MHICLNTLNSLTFGLFRGYLYLPIIARYVNVAIATKSGNKKYEPTEDEINRFKQALPEMWDVRVTTPKEHQKEIDIILKRHKLQQLKSHEFAHLLNLCKPEYQTYSRYSPQYSPR